MTSVKRPRTPSQSSTSSNSSPTHANANSLTSPYNNHQPPHKSTRIVPSNSLSPQSIGANLSRGSTNKAGTFDIDTPVIPETRHPLLCTLPPTCHRHPTPIADTNDLERHYATYHAHVCSVKGCGCVFPDERLLELHQTECHDPIASLRKERGEKIFQCHLPSPTCGRSFLTPKARRLHLIQAHAFPKEYFFAVTNKGVGGLLKKWGEGASLIRKEWKTREGGKEKGVVDMKSHREGGDEMVVNDEEDGEEEEDDQEEEEDEEEEEEPDDLEATPRMLPRQTISVHSPQSSLTSHPETDNGNTDGRTANKNDLMNLTESLESLSLVPNSIRFGRGGKNGGFIPRGHGTHGRGGGRGGGGRGRRYGRGGAGPGGGDGMEVDGVSGASPLVVQVRGRGRGRPPRGNGRGRG